VTIRGLAWTGLTWWLASGCAEPQLPSQALPELSAASTAPTALAADELLFTPGERMAWDVRMRGISVGTAELVVAGAGVASPSELVITSRFRTNDLASSMLSVEHRLITVVHGADAASSVDDLMFGRSHRRIETTFAAGIYRVDSVAHRAPPGAVQLHTLHSALGWMRSWAGADAEPGHIHILHRRNLYRLEIGAPLREPAPGTSTAALRVDCQALPVDARGGGILLTVWLSDDERRLPLRLDAVVDGMRVLADLIDRNP
jgi:hypothetical protein